MLYLYKFTIASLSLFCMCVLCVCSFDCACKCKGAHMWKTKVDVRCLPQTLSTLVYQGSTSY